MKNNLTDFELIRPYQIAYNVAILQVLNLLAKEYSQITNFRDVALMATQNMCNLDSEWKELIKNVETENKTT